MSTISRVITSFSKLSASSNFTKSICNRATELSASGISKSRCLSSIILPQTNFVPQRMSTSSFLSGVYLKNLTANDSALIKNENYLSWARPFCLTMPTYKMSLKKMHEKGPYRIKRKKKNPLGPNVPQAKGIVLKTLVKKPRKPNSANRKCVLIRLHTGKELVAYIPGEGHNLQEHNVVLVRVGRLRDTPGVKVKCIRGKYDLPHVIKRKEF